MLDSWYPLAGDYWVPPEEADGYPLRYGDVCATPDIASLRTSKGRPWSHVLVLHPSCEIGPKAAADTEVLVARVNRVDDIGANRRSAVRVGWAERQGRILIAHANTFWLPPRPAQDGQADWYADFRRVRSVPLTALRSSGREAAMSHDARVRLIRREIYFKYWWLVASDDVQANEKARISNDHAFEGPRPSWAGSDT